MKIGFIGCGNMGKAMLRGIIDKKTRPEDIWVITKRTESREKLREEYKVNTAGSNIEVVTKSDLIFLAVKPYMFPDILKEIKEEVKDKILVSIAAGVTISSMEDILGADKKIVRAMPNTPAFVGEAMTSVTPNKNISEKESKAVTELLESFGKIEEVGEDMIHAVIGASGSSPAYVFMFIEAMADAAVLKGMPRDKAYKFAAQGVLGAAKMVLDTGIHPGQLKDMVCSPGGTTIEGVAELEKSGMKGSVISALIKCMEKSEEMSKG